MSMELLARAFGARLRQTELELKYWPANSPMTDFCIDFGEVALISPAPLPPCDLRRVVCGLLICSVLSRRAHPTSGRARVCLSASASRVPCNLPAPPSSPQAGYFARSLRAFSCRHRHLDALPKHSEHVSRLAVEIIAPPTWHLHLTRDPAHHSFPRLPCSRAACKL